MTTIPFRPLPFLRRDVSVERREDGVQVLRHPEPLKATEPHIPAVMRRQAQARPQHPWIAQRPPGGGDWQRLSFGQGQQQVDALTQALIDLDAPGRTVMVLSGNSIEHGLVALAAMQAGMPCSPITPAYSLLSQDHAKLRAMAALLEPAVVFVQNGRSFEAALRALQQAGLLQGVAVWCVDEPLDGLVQHTWTRLLATPVRSDVDAAVARLHHGTVAKYLFTSGSTGLPKAVTVTQGMMCHAMAMTSQMVQWGDDAPATVLLDWLPWSHVAGGSAIFNAVIEDGGTLYIDDGRPQPGAFEATLRNLREVSPVRFSSMPAAYAMLLEALEHDEALGQSFFRNLRRLTYSGSRLPDAVYHGMQAQAVRHTGYRIPFISAYGSTETSAAVTYVYWPSERAGLIGLPHPGVELKLVPLDDGRHEIRVRSPAVTPGYLKQPEVTAQSFDEEGFLRMGDAATFVDPADPLQGLAFAGRVAEEFKLQTGVFVRVSALRVACIDALAPLVSDAVVTGADRAEVGLLVWLNLAACRERLGRPQATAAELAADPALRALLRERLATHNAQHAGSSQRIRRLAVLLEPASMDAGEITDKGHVNQRRVLERRADAVERLYAQPPGPEVLLID